MYKITLADGTELENLELNGNNYAAYEQPGRGRTFLVCAGRENRTAESYGADRNIAYV